MKNILKKKLYIMYFNYIIKNIIENINNYQHLLFPNSIDLRLLNIEEINERIENLIIESNTLYNSDKLLIQLTIKELEKSIENILNIYNVDNPLYNTPFNIYSKENPALFNVYFDLYRM